MEHLALTTAHLQRFVRGKIFETWGEGTVAALLIEPTTNHLVVVYDMDNDPMDPQICVIGLTFSRIDFSGDAIGILNVVGIPHKDRVVVLIPPDHKN